MLAIHADLNLTGLQKAARSFGAKQMPFATALALTRLAQGVSAAETQAVIDTFDNPTPFTQKGFRVQPARKSEPVAYVMAKDIAAQYLAPYVFGGDRSLGNKKAMIVPRDVALNQYGNLTRNKLASLKGKPGVFVGKVKTKKGAVISGVWQRPMIAAASGKRGKKAAPKPSGGLKLLIQFEDTTPAPKHLPFFERAKAYVRANAAAEFQAALRQALSTARR
ncbi:hypothetical protein [Novosphingobium sp. 9]|uniref:hypothetical protein n=1 Tax=Novosphingobium sp. 9 TaxID=2025349 RepID=UPI0021B6E39C|nr:hypothetical protein [Novosphingobium sp. 9]